MPYFVLLKSIITIVLFLFVNICLAVPNECDAIKVCDTNNEMVAGAKVQIDHLTFYTNINGVCLVPKSILAKAKSIKIECISFKTKQLNISELNSKIILDNR